MTTRDTEYIYAYQYAYIYEVFGKEIVAGFLCVDNEGSECWDDTSKLELFQRPTDLEVEVTE